MRIKNIICVGPRNSKIRFLNGSKLLPLWRLDKSFVRFVRWLLEVIDFVKLYHVPFCIMRKVEKIPNLVLGRTFP